MSEYSKNMQAVREMRERTILKEEAETKAKEQALVKNADLPRPADKRSGVLVKITGDGENYNHKSQHSHKKRSAIFFNRVLKRAGLESGQQRPGYGRG